MTDVRVNGVPHQPVGSLADGIGPDRLRTIVQESHPGSAVRRHVRGAESGVNLQKRVIVR